MTIELSVRIPQSNSDYAAHYTTFANELQALSSQLNHPLALNGTEGRLPAGEWRVLQTLGSMGSSTVPQIARVRSTSRQNIQVLVNRLREAGYVTQRSNPAHKRSVLIELTDAGQVLMGSAGDTQTRMAAELAKVISAKELEATTGVLRRLRQVVGGVVTKDVESKVEKRPRLPTPSHPPEQKARPAEIVPEESVSESNEFPLALL